eukprot:TRINITY_DN48181_c0_g1_i1.p1 TRINITY_DN48181_c0_g1~~TRINITY_DN48181_c0_g1_i1.p1  ORF type:complete len:578 (+),score=125.10 TRINITY_DN48181_c0_g1_i1:94-1827(+)
MAIQGSASRGAVEAEEDEGADALVDLISPADVNEFFSTTWQKKPAVFTGASWSTPGGARRPIRQQTWEDCLDTLALASCRHPALHPPDGCELLIFKGRQITHDYDDCGPCEALLDGASCVVNHAEFIWEPLWRLCLRLRRQLLHVYANTYVTPPTTQTVPPHADDRDVFVLQLCGSKHWRVYGTPPVVFPYADEQAGKNFPVPQELIDSEPMLECVLNPGDVLYMPRGFVHEACCPGSGSSWHATLAVATHDWSWTKVAGAAVTNIMDADSGGRWRSAVPLSLGMPSHSPGPRDEVDSDESEQILKEFLHRMQEVVKLPQLRQRFKQKMQMHNQNQEENVMQFLGCLNRYAAAEADFAEPVGFSLRHWRTRHVRLDTRLCKVDACVQESSSGSFGGALGSGKGGGGYGQNSCMGKGGGKMKGGSWKGGGQGSADMVVRTELVNAVVAALREVERRGEDGMLVSELPQAVTNSRDVELFDELAQICLGRCCVGSGAFQIFGGTIDDVDRERAARWDCSPPASSAMASPSRGIPPISVRSSPVEPPPSLGTLPSVAAAVSSADEQEDDDAPSGRRCVVS